MSNEQEEVTVEGESVQQRGGFLVREMSWAGCWSGRVDGPSATEALIPGIEASAGGGAGGRAYPTG